MICKEEEIAIKKLLDEFHQTFFINNLFCYLKNKHSHKETGENFAVIVIKIYNKLKEKKKEKYIFGVDILIKSFWSYKKLIRIPTVFVFFPFVFVKKERAEKIKNTQKAQYSLNTK